MRLLLDTHVVVESIMAGPREGTRLHKLLSSQENELFYSMVSVWEIAIKHGLPGDRRDAMPVSPRDFVHHADESGFRYLPITPEHAFGLKDLRPLHGDPFDRLLVSQAIAEPMRLVTRDKLLAAYSDFVLVV